MRTLIRIIRNETFAAYLLLPVGIIAILFGSHYGSHFFEVNRQIFGFNFNWNNFILQFLLGFFFYNIGLELRYEFSGGALKDKKVLTTSAIAAICGMVAPALIFIIYSHIDGRSDAGWGITMATDLPIVLAMVAILKKSKLKGFILALATIDDIGSIIVIAILYKTSIHGWYLAATFAALAVYILASYFFASRALLVLIFIVGLVLGHASGFQISLISVIFGLATINMARSKPDIVQPLILAIEPISAFIAIPLLVFASFFRHFDFSERSLTTALVVLLVVSRVIGKPLGIFFGIAISKLLFKVKLGFSQMDSLLIGGLGILGLDVSLIFAQLQFKGALLNLSILAILVTLPVGFVICAILRLLSPESKTL